MLLLQPCRASVPSAVLSEAVQAEKRRVAVSARAGDVSDVAPPARASVPSAVLSEALQAEKLDEGIWIRRQESKGERDAAAMHS